MTDSGGISRQERLIIGAQAAPAIRSGRLRGKVKLVDRATGEVKREMAASEWALKVLVAAGIELEKLPRHKDDAFACPGCSGRKTATATMCAPCRGGLASARMAEILREASVLRPRGRPRLDRHQESDLYITPSGAISSRLVAPATNDPPASSVQEDACRLVAYVVLNPGCGVATARRRTMPGGAAGGARWLSAIERVGPALTARRGGLRIVVDLLSEDVASGAMTLIRSGHASQ